MAQVHSNAGVLPPGGGFYALPSLSLGIFRNDQPTHHFSHASSATAHVPLMRNQGWLLPAGSDGICSYDASLEVVFVTVDRRILEDFGCPTDVAFDAIIGDLDPLVLQLSLALSDTAGAARERIYRETMQNALAAQIVQTIMPLPPLHLGMEDRRLRRVLEYIHDNLATDLSMTVMADLAAMSPSHFARSFRKVVGMSPLQYIIATRLDMAALLLRTTRFSVSEVAWRVGYQDMSRFAMHFRRKFGATPAEYRPE
ncbi:helix-turn-helix domain-containing protein [Amaricoccus macauensis]|uniref:helix-turn-helix domain-containing protein n=1 Tax=Amaricoccus macauensis TaxID=57001 RepID=UPI003C7AA421